MCQIIVSFPPLRKVQSCIVLKAICESQRQVGRRERGVVGNCHTVVLENHKAEDRRLRSPLGNSTQGSPLYTQRGGLQWVNHKVQELGCWLLHETVQAFATRIWQTTMCSEEFQKAEKEEDWS